MGPDVLLIDGLCLISRTDVLDPFNDHVRAFIGAVWHSQLNSFRLTGTGEHVHSTLLPNARSYVCKEARPVIITPIQYSQRL